MESVIGQGKHYFQDFAVDFSSKDTHIGSKVFPKGYLAVAVMNYGKEVTTQLLYAGALLLSGQLRGTAAAGCRLF